MDTEQWLNHLLPCPKELSIDDSIEIEIAHLVIETVGDANPLVEQAAAELNDLLPQPKVKRPAEPGLNLHNYVRHT